MKIEIQELDSVWTEICKKGYRAINTELSYTAVYWKKSWTGRKERVEYTKYLCKRIGGKYLFLTGLVPRVLAFLDYQGYEYIYRCETPVVSYDSINLPGADLRSYQREIITIAVETGRGVIQSVTGSGKTYGIAGILSCFSMENCIILVHTISIAQQLFEVLQKFKFEPSLYSGKSREISRITVATIQSYKKIAKEYSEFWDVCIIDECHHVQKIDSKNYGFTLQCISAPCRFGFTATIPESIEGKFAMEGLIGPVIYQYTNQQATKDKILATPKILLYTPSFSEEILKLKDYGLQYKQGITFNEQRNLLIVKIAIEFIKKRKSTLILINQLDHGKNLQNLFSRYGYQIDFVQGETLKEVREDYKNKLKIGQIFCLLASTIWIEGLDLPSLSTLILASGGKSNLTTTQKIGRCLRRTESKTKATIVDFLDDGKYLRKHSLQRIRLYKKNNWEIESQF